MPSIASASEDALPPLPQSGRCLLPLWEGAPGSVAPQECYGHAEAAPHS
jgi:hypothetical protein